MSNGHTELSVFISRLRLFVLLFIMSAVKYCLGVLITMRESGRLCLLVAKTVFGDMAPQGSNLEL